ncbi:MAG: hypothetical protein ACO1RA_16980 [Planctomycetaceae bacterium]
MLDRRHFLALALAAGAGTLLRAAEGPLPAEHHPWGRFPVGSWKTVSVETETSDAAGKPKSKTTTETKTTLVAADASSYTLKIEVTVDVQGKRFLSQAQTIKTGYCGEVVGQTLSSRSEGKSEVEIGEEKIPCEIRKLTIEDSDTRRVTTVHYNSQVPPYILSRESVLTRLQDNTTTKTETKVTALRQAYTLLGEEHRATRFHTVVKKSGIEIITTDEVHCADVPGGVVEHTSSESLSNKELRRSKLTLVDYGLGKVSAEDAWKGRRRVWQRNRRQEMRDSEKRS